VLCWRYTAYICHVLNQSPYTHRKQISYEDEECILDIFDTAGQEDFSVRSRGVMMSFHELVLT
jgi:hypothetical protein